MTRLSMPSVFKTTISLFLAALILLVIYIKPTPPKPSYSDFILLEKEFENFQAATPAEEIDLGLHKGAYVQEGLDSSNRLNFFSEERYNTQIEPDVYNCEKTSCDPLSLLKDDIYQSYICGHIKSLPFGFFDEPPYISNNGYSFVFRAFHSSGKEFDSKEWLKVHRQYLSLAEVTLSRHIRSSLGLDKISLDSELVTQINTGTKLVAYKKKFYIKEKTGALKYKVYRFSELSKFLEKKSLYSLSQTQQDSCILKGSGFCFKKVTTSQASSAQTLFYILLTTLILVSLFLILTHFLKFKRDSKQSNLRKLALDNLTHDFRTPVTNMVMMTKDFDHIFQNSPHRDQIKWLNFSSQVHKLYRATEDTKNYIQLLASNKIAKTTIPSINTWLSSICDEDISLSLNKKDFSLETSPYWLHVCLRNLIKNAKDHGGDKITVTVKENRTDLVISILDSGPGLSSSLLDLTNEFSKGSKSSGLGLGLSIVAKATELMGGKLTYSENPTQFSIKLKKGPSVYAENSYR